MGACSEPVECSLAKAHKKMFMACKKADWQKVIDLFAGYSGLSTGFTLGVYTPITCFKMGYWVR